jgi:hypothetical protein
MAPQPPLLLVDNLFDVGSLYPAGSLRDSSELTGREAFRIIDARRERSWWQPASSIAANYVDVDLGAGNTGTIDYIWLDRGHQNLWGNHIEIHSSDVGTAGTYAQYANLTVPALGTVGGDPVTGSTFSVTEEGALYKLLSLSAAHRFWRVLVTENVVPSITGLMLGKRSQFLGYSRVRDEDQGNRTEIQEMSRAGYLGTDRRYGWRTFALDLNYIGATEYDGTIRSLRRTLFELDQPFVGIINYGDKPERAWLYRWDGTQFSAPMNRTYRGVQIRGREVGPLIR